MPPPRRWRVRPSARPGSSAHSSGALFRVGGWRLVAGGLGVLGGVEEDLGDRDVVVATTWHVVLHRVLVALDRVAVRDRAGLRRRRGALWKVDLGGRLLGEVAV